MLQGREECEALASTGDNVMQRSAGTGGAACYGRSGDWNENGRDGRRDASVCFSSFAVILCRTCSPALPCPLVCAACWAQNTKEGTPHSNGD